MRVDDIYTVINTSLFITFFNANGPKRMDDDDDCVVVNYVTFYFKFTKSYRHA